VLNELFDWIKSIIFALIIVLILNMFLGITTVYNTSMYPTLKEKNILLINKISKIDQGDIITFKTNLKLSKTDIETLNPIKRLLVNENTTKNLVKRVIGLPGDKIEINSGFVFVNDVKLDETYVDAVTMGDVVIESLPDNMYFVMGDNRSVSLDSRSEIIGLINKEDIIGIAEFIFWPISDFSTF